MIQIRNMGASLTKKKISSISVADADNADGSPQAMKSNRPLFHQNEPGRIMLTQNKLLNVQSVVKSSLPS